MLISQSSAGTERITAPHKNIVILGSGRSGTSMLAGLFAEAGYFMGDNLYPARDSNPKGFFEDPEINGINEALLARVLPQNGSSCEIFRDGQRWLARVPIGTEFPHDDTIIQRIKRVTQREPFCIKDPRFSYTIPVWKPHLNSTVFICVFRDPATTVRSIIKECNEMEYLQDLKMDRNIGEEIWYLTYKHIADIHRHEGNWFFAHYEQLFLDQVLERLEQFTGTTIDRLFPDNSLSRSKPDFIASPKVLDLYEELCGLAGYQHDTERTLKTIVSEQAKQLGDLETSVRQKDLVIQTLQKRSEPDPSVRQEGKNELSDKIYCQIQSYISEGRIDEALRALEGLISMDPDHALAHNDLGVLCYQRGFQSEAQSHYERAVQINPANVTFKKNLADFYYVESERIEDALLLYRSVLKADPRDIEALLMAANLSAVLKRFDESADFYRKVLDIEPANQMAQENLEAMPADESPRVKSLRNHLSAVDELLRATGENLLTIDELNRLNDGVASLIIRVQERIREAEAKEKPLLPHLINTEAQPMSKHILDRSAPWKQMKTVDYHIPGMITNEEKQYYLYITSYYSGRGEVIELGPWLGCSTAYIIHGLMHNIFFKDHSLFVYDDFIWRSSWMDSHYNEYDKPENLKSFRHIFEKFTAPFMHYLTVYENKICDYDGNEHLQQFTWNGDDIELCFIDCGRNLSVNDVWYRSLSKNFIPNRTLLILQDWQTHKEIPAKWYNQMKIFTESKGHELELVHELLNCGVATFLYRGR